MFKKIMWATDGSRAADEALPYVESLAAQSGAKIVIGHANELMVGRMGGYAILADEDDIQARIHRRADELRAAGFHVETIVRTAAGKEPASLLATIARDSGCDLVVAATVGHSVFGSLLAGSVTQRLPHVLPCPVLVVPVHERVDADQPEPIEVGSKS
jgi:nucleotide-binding universal stress UspA family protein